MCVYRSSSVPRRPSPCFDPSAAAHCAQKRETLQKCGCQKKKTEAMIHLFCFSVLPALEVAFVLPFGFASSGFAYALRVESFSLSFDHYTVASLAFHVCAPPPTHTHTHLPRLPLSAVSLCLCLEVSQRRPRRDVCSIRARSAASSLLLLQPQRRCIWTH